ncbi:MAG: pantetheine-phosphate adenylyltransferase [Oscillospiraceae bacterium]|nr:pantetheine-phosphate adenylyltransferase [Oscillospiraceae bacterium]
MKIAICPGSFDPITKGHVDIIERTSKLFDKVYAVVMVNPSKTPTFTTEERVDMIKKCTAHLDNVEAESFTGLIADYAKQKNAQTLVKGLRAVTDFEYEFQQALTNKKLNPNLETLFMVTNQEYMYLSSTIVRQIAEFGGDIEQFVPHEIKDELIRKMIKEN